MSLVDFTSLANERRLVNFKFDFVFREEHGIAALAMKGDRFHLVWCEDVGRMDDFGVNASCAEPSF